MFNYKILYNVKFVVPLLGIWGSFASFIGLKLAVNSAISESTTIWVVVLSIVSGWATYLIYKNTAPGI